MDIANIYIPTAHRALFSVSANQFFAKLHHVQRSTDGYTLPSMIQGLNRQVRDLPKFKSELARIVEPSTVRWYTMVSGRQHIETFGRICRARDFGDEQYGENALQKYIKTLSRALERLRLLEDIPSFFSELPLLVILSFVAWGLLARTTRFVEKSADAIRDLLNNVLVNLRRAFRWSDDVNCGVVDSIGHVTHLIVCFQDTLRFETVFDNDQTEQIFSGFQQEISHELSFQRPDNQSCLYHTFEHSWIRSFRDLTDPTPEITAVMAEYVMTWEIRSKSQETDHLPSAYRGCNVEEGVPMVRSVVLQGLLMSLYKSLVPLIEDLSSLIDCNSGPCVVLDGYMRLFMEPSLQTILLLSGGGATYHRAQEACFMSVCRRVDEHSEASATESV